MIRKKKARIYPSASVENSTNASRTTRRVASSSNGSSPVAQAQAGLRPQQPQTAEIKQISHIINTTLAPGTSEVNCGRLPVVFGRVCAGRVSSAKWLSRGEIALKNETDLSLELDEGKARPREVPG